jgi:hypothetical protein
VHGKVADVKSWAGLTGQDIGRRIVEWAVLVCPHNDPDDDVPVGGDAAKSAESRHDLGSGVSSKGVQ